MSGRSQRPVWLGEDRRTWDHVRIHLQVLKDERLGAYEIAVYLGIVAHAEIASGRARPSQATLAQYAQISDRKVRDCIQRLEDLSYIAVERVDGRASTYAVLPPPPLDEPRNDVPGSEPATPAGGSGDPGTAFRPTPEPRSDEQEPVELEPGTRTPPAPKGEQEPSPVRAVFTAWLNSTNRSARTVLDGTRRRLIERALRDYPLQDVLDAVRGWEHSAFHRGRNEHRKPYNDLGLLLRNAEHIERFRDFARGPREPDQPGRASVTNVTTDRSRPTGRVEL